MGGNTVKTFRCTILPLKLHCLQDEIIRTFDIKTCGLYDVSLLDNRD